MAASDRIPRQYQDYIFRRAKEKNVIAVLPTGSGKTYIACMLMTQFASQLQEPFSVSGKRIFFLVPQKVLVNQQAEEIRRTTPFTEDVAEITGDSDTDFWSADKWTEHLNTFKIFVMIHDIFKNLLDLGNVLPLDKISLIVFDEAHHAARKKKGKMSKHPYRQILESLSKKQSGSSPVRLLGLTASLINNKVASDETVVTAYISDLEEAFLDAECIVVDTAEIVRYKTNAKVIIWLSECAKDMFAQQFVTETCLRLTEMAQNLVTGHQILRDKKISFPIDCDDAAKVLVRLSKCVCEMSLWVGQQFCVEYYKEMSDSLEVYADSYTTYASLLRGLMACIRKIADTLSELMSHLTEEEQIVSISSPKLIRLLQLLENYSFNQENETFRGIIFVETRLEAKAFAIWIQKASHLIPTLSYIKADYMTGYSSRPGFVDKVSRLSRKHQKETLAKFRGGKLNLLVATNVLEEGLDVPECNCVIRYDLPDTYRSFQQSMGRARAADAAFVLMCNDGVENVKLMRDLSDFESLGRAITAICKKDKDRRDTACGIISHLSNEEEERVQKLLNAQNVVHPETGAEITAGSAVSRVYEYLSQSSYGWTPRPEHSFPRTANGDVVCEVKLPICSGIPETVCGRPMPSELHAKKSAYLEICLKLMHRRLLDQHLRPIPKKVLVMQMLSHLNLDVPREEIAGDGRIPGTRKRKQEYMMMSPSSSSSSSDFHFLYLITIHDHMALANPQQLGVLSPIELPSQVLTTITLFKTNREVRVSLEKVKKIAVPHPSLRSALWFHEFVFCQMLDFESRVEFAFDSNQSILVVALSATNEIDVVYMDSVKEKEANRTPLIFNDDGFGQKRSNIFSFEAHLYDDVAVRRWYKHDQNANGTPTRDLKSWTQSWKVVGIEKKLDDLIPNEAVTYGHYYSKQYNLLASNYSQKLLRVVPASQMAALTKNERSRGIKLMHFVPEFCEICPMSATMWEKVTCLPAFLHRLSQLRMASQFRHILAHDVRLEIDADKPFHELSFVAAPIAADVRHVSKDDKTAGEPLSKRVNKEEVPTTGKRVYNEDETSSDDDDDQSDMMTVGGGGDPVVSAALFGKALNKRIFGLIRRSLPTGPQVFHPNSMFLHKEFQSKINPTAPRLSHVDLQKLEEVCKSTIDLLKDVLMRASGFIFQDFAISLKHEDPSRLLLHDDSAFAVVPSFDDEPENPSFPPDLYIEVFSAKSAHDVVNSERLETLGDSFLKFAVSSYLHARCYDRSRNPDINLQCLTEGHLTAIKGQLVSNYNLYRLSKAIDCGRRMFVNEFSPKANWLPPAFSELPDKQGNRTKQIISDKAVADSVEALVGALVLKLGDVEAVKFLTWLGLPVALNDQQLMRGRQWLPQIDPVFQTHCGSNEADERMQFLYDRSHILRLEKILNYNFRNQWFAICAITHSSCCDNWYTGSYEKLEFLGDAVLDRLIATFCFRYKYPNGTRLDPGQMTDLRSALVNNAYLGCLLVKFDLHKSIFMMAHELKSLIDTCADSLRANADQIQRTIGSYVMVKSDEDGGERFVPIEVNKVLGDVLEALIGAIFLDSGRSLDAVWRVVYGLMKTELTTFVNDIPKNPIRLIHEADPDLYFFEENQTDTHSFEVKLNFKGKDFVGNGRNYRFARLHAAMRALF